MIIFMLGMPIGPHHWKCTGLCEGVGSNPVFFLRASSVAALQGLEICFWLVVSCCFNTSPKVRSTCRGPCGRARSMIVQENRPCLFTRHRGRCTDRTLRTSWERACRPKRLGITIWGETRLCQRGRLSAFDAWEENKEREREWEGEKWT